MIADRTRHCRGRRPRRPAETAAFSPEVPCYPAWNCEIATSAAPPRNDKPVCFTPPNYYCNTCDCLWRSLSAATDAIGAYHFTLTSMGRKCLPEIATGAKRPRNDTSGSAKVHQRPCTVELPRTGRTGSAAAIRPASWCGRWSGRKFVSRARGNNEDLRRQENAVSAFP